MEAIAVHHELDDDVFFADLSKQISLLIMDDDDDGDLVTHSSSVSLQGYSQSNHYPATQQALLPFVYDHQACRRESKGTGVFIPTSLISQPRRKNKLSGKSNNSTDQNSSSSSKFQKNHHHIPENSRGMTPHQYRQQNVSYDHKASTYDSFNLPKELY